MRFSKILIRVSIFIQPELSKCHSPPRRERKKFDIQTTILYRKRTEAALLQHRGKEELDISEGSIMRRKNLVNPRSISSHSPALTGSDCDSSVILVSLHSELVSWDLMGTEQHLDKLQKDMEAQHRHGERELVHGRARARNPQGSKVPLPHAVGEGCRGFERA